MASPSSHVVDVNEHDFVAQVIEHSRKVPVIIDFWASWCGPCKTLGPVLEGLAAEYGGAFRLAKVDVDQNPQLAAYFRAQSIPTVYAVWNGQPVDAFVGALPKPQVKEFIDKVLAAAGVAPPSAKAEVPKDPAKAEAFWRARADEDPEDGEALLALGRLLLTSGRDEEARAVLERVKPAMPEYNAAQASLALGGLWAQVQAAGGEEAVAARLEADPADPKARYLAALADAVRGDFAAGLATLVELVGAGGPAVRDAAKAAASTIFEAAGRDDERIEGLRRRLARLLF